MREGLNHDGTTSTTKHGAFQPFLLFVFLCAFAPWRETLEFIYFPQRREGAKKEQGNGGFPWRTLASLAVQFERYGKGGVSQLGRACCRRCRWGL